MSDFSDVSEIDVYSYELLWGIHILQLLQLYNQGISLYHERKFSEAVSQFAEILKKYPEDGPSQMYRLRCEVLRDFPPKVDWDFVFDMGEK